MQSIVSFQRRLAKSKYQVYKFTTTIGVSGFCMNAIIDVGIVQAFFFL